MCNRLDLKCVSCACAAAQQGLQEGDVSGAVTKCRGLAGREAVVGRGLPVEPALPARPHGEGPQMAHPLKSHVLEVIHRDDAGVRHAVRDPA